MRHCPLPALYSVAGSNCQVFLYERERFLWFPQQKKTKVKATLQRERTIILCHLCFYCIVDGMESSKRERVNICHKGPHHEQTRNILIVWYASYLTTRKSLFSFAKFSIFILLNQWCSSLTSLNLLTCHGFTVTLKFTQISI